MQIKPEELSAIGGSFARLQGRVRFLLTINQALCDQLKQVDEEMQVVQKAMIEIESRLEAERITVG